MLRDIRMSNALVLQNRQDVALRPVSDAVYAALYEGEGAHFMVESVSLADIESTYFYDTPILEEASAMFEAVTSTRARLSGTMRAFVKALNQGLSGTGITAGNDTAGDSDDGGQAIGGANIGRVRKVQGLAVMPAVIPLSDGQTVTLVFHSPSGNASTIAATDSLVAFQFLLNKKDVTHTVSPSNGRDISLKQVTTALSNLIERNTAKFQHAQAKQKALKAELSNIQEEGDKLEGQQASLVEQGDQLKAGTTDLAQQLQQLTYQADQQEELNEELQAELAAAQEKAAKPQPDPAPAPAGQDNSKLYWYGLRARAAGPGSLPAEPKPEAIVTPDEAADIRIVLDKGFDPSDYRHGAVAYTTLLSADDVAQYELVDFQVRQTATSITALLNDLIPLMKSYPGNENEFYLDYLANDAPHADDLPQSMKDAGGYAKVRTNYGYKTTLQMIDLFKKVKAENPPEPAPAPAPQPGTGKRKLVARAVEDSKGEGGDRDGRIMMSIEGPEDFIEWATKDLEKEYDNLQTAGEPKNEGEVSAIFGVDRADKALFMARWKQLKTAWVNGEDYPPMPGDTPADKDTTPVSGAQKLGVLIGIAADLVNAWADHQNYSDDDLAAMASHLSTYKTPANVDRVHNALMFGDAFLKLDESGSTPPEPAPAL
ncbi:hypothetical protein CYR55_22320 [Chimaeribacter californicus]|uniref:Defence against restriction A N-terminal domain-containing protein n=1 Tax=Chimaeribacter californicus TaxID=2060067 RepID=A0A2N5DU69_9GAMM|nr:hypothetical protein [Chimaeribacter californicus]PLR30292.1 hypothetical protein CYR55_22320 [Chimaeribacter californicus]